MFYEVYIKISLKYCCIFRFLADLHSTLFFLPFFLISLHFLFPAHPLFQVSNLSVYLFIHLLLP